jgi:ATP-dependent DNA helicase RecG
LGFVVIDEQHRFGVMQRADLQQKGYNPDVLVMTATPIPRTLALTVYGDLDVSIINELPPGRTPIKTQWFPLGARREVYRFIRHQLEQGRQAYIVCPLIEESEALEAQAATEEAEKVRKEFPRFQVGLLHGRMSMEEKDKVMKSFRDSDLHLLTSTTVIEVGIDVPNATVMLILNAERFGLAQLHQLRGRVGRGAEQSYCFLLTEAKYNPHEVEDVHNAVYREGRRRMEVMTETTDGFVIAEEDLLLRGPGEIAGTRQSGLPELHIADVVKDIDILEQARQAAFQFVAGQPDLDAPEYAALKRYLDARFTARVDLARVS